MEQVTSSSHSSALYKLIDECSVRLDLPNGGIGSGFFVAQGQIITCDHVIRGLYDSPNLIKVSYKGRSYKVLDIEVDEKSIADLALILIKIFEDHPCVMLDPYVDPHHLLYTFGYSSKAIEGQGCTASYEGVFNSEKDGGLLKFKLGNIIPGLSGSPLLNMSTLKVCGVVKRSRDVSTDAGGYAVSIEQVYQSWRHLKESQRKFHQVDARWEIASSQLSHGSISQVVQIETNKKRATVSVEFKLNRKLSDFPPDIQRKFKHAIAVLAFMEDSEIDIKNVREGSVIITLEIPSEKLQVLMDAFDSGALAEWQVSEITLIELERDITDKAKNSSAYQPFYSAKAKDSYFTKKN